MNKFKTILMSLGLIFTFAFQSSAQAADLGFQSEQEVMGSWLLEYTKISDKTKERGDTWVFENGSMVMKDIPRTRGDKYDASPVAYKVEDGKLKISVLGRPGRFDTYELVGKTDSTMDLKSNMGEIFHFIKK